METKAQKAALSQIEKLKEEIIKISLEESRHYSYAYSMKAVEERFEEYLNEVNNLTKEYDLGDDIHSKFKREAAEIIYDAAMKREEYKWAASFAKKYGL